MAKFAVYFKDKEDPVVVEADHRESRQTGFVYFFPGSGSPVSGHQDREVVFMTRWEHIRAVHRVGSGRNS
jgi:hypothetical protein